MTESARTKYYLVTDADAETVENATGLRGHNTLLGALVERPRAFDLDRALDDLDRAMHPNKTRCICGSYAIGLDCGPHQYAPRRHCQALVGADQALVSRAI